MNMANDLKFVRKEREHLDVLHRRLDHLRVDDPSRRGNPAYPPGEANALAWALTVIEGDVEPLSVRMERIERKLRVIETRLGNVERDQRGDG